VATKTNSQFEFIDLFAGIGGFAAALSAFGGKPVYSVEIDEAAAKIYERNWGHSPLGDITEDANETTMNVPPHNILAAGFPCQPFSKSGAQKGMDETRGTLFWNIMEIVKAHHPQIVLLENVRNLAGPRHTHEWKVIIERLRGEGYVVSDHPAIFSPHLLPKALGGRPQIRERVFITATYAPDIASSSVAVEPVVSIKDHFEGWNPQKWNLTKDLPLTKSSNVKGCELTASEIRWIDAWDEWVQLYYKLSNGVQPPGFPIWVDEWVETSKLRITEDTPEWKANFLRKNAALYTSHKKEFDAWLRKHGVLTADFPPSRRKFEWQAQDAKRLWDCVMHFRPSGIRAKKATYLPALVAITQTSIIGPLRRRLSTREAARLQGLPEWFSFGDQRDGATYKQLGNGVNIGVVWHVLKKHVERDEAILKVTKEGRAILKAIGGSPASPDETLDSMGK
jgi:DNA (cytosine-5)-methyltransferase 1